jgi:Mrp family chromosome partitioning ATPase/uncharacterized protein involved in exopolysaccharide biosynthesis
MSAANSLVSKKDIARVLSIVRKNWYIPLILGVAGVLVGNFYTYRLTSIYAAKTQILLRSNDQISPGSVISDNGYYSNTTKTFVDNSNEKRVIMSYDLISQAIDRLDFDVSYFLVGRVKTEEIFRTAPFIVTVNSISSDLYEQKMNINFLSSNSFAITYTKNDQQEVVKGVYGQELVTRDFSLMVRPRGTLTGNQTNAMKNADYLLQVHSRDNLIKRFQTGMKVESPDYTNILEISVNDVIPARAVMFLDTLVQVYVENSIMQRLDLNQNTLFFIDKQLSEVELILNNIEDTLQEFREDENIFDLDREGVQYFEQYIGYDVRKRSLQMQSASLTDLESYIRDNKDPQFLPPSAYFSYGDPFLDRYVANLYELQVTYSTILGQGTPNNPELIDLRTRIDNLKKDMLVYIANNREAINENIVEVNKQMDTTQSNIQTLPLKQRGLVNITRKLKVNENMYLFLLQRKANTVIARAGILPEVKVIERARSMGIIEPDRDKIGYYFLAGSLILALLIVGLRVLLFEKVESTDELKTMTNIPVAGEVLHYKSATELKVVVEVDPKSVIAESFRTIRTNLQYMLGDKRKAQIVVTSNSPGEGKTFCSINLAAILAKGGKRVILLELDLHRPRVQAGLNITSANGFSNPSEIVVSSKLEEVLQYCRDNYDFTIIDTPPVGLISDALVLMKVADYTLFVVSVKVSYRTMINRILELFDHNKIKNVSFILNYVKKKRSRYYYGGYRYGRYGGYGGYGSYGGGYGSYGSYGESEPPKKPGKNSTKGPDKKD